MTRGRLRGLPATLGRYELIGLLGRGGMGRVVRARDTVLKREVALKLVEAADEGAQAEVRFMFHREARAAAQLKHANVLEIYDYSGPDAPLPFIAAELVVGPTLRDVLEETEAPLPPAQAAALGYELAAALEHAHARGVVHRDMKPENVFWQADGRVVLADFGIAKALDAHALGLTVQFGATNLYGSPAYLAPEQLRGDAAEGRTDVYALGLTLFEALTLQQGLAGESLEELLAAAERGAQLTWPEALRDTELARVIEALTSAAVAARPSAAEAQQRLRGVLDELGVTDPRLALRRGADPANRTPETGGHRKPEAGDPSPETYEHRTLDAGHRSPEAAHRPPVPRRLWLLAAFVLLLAVTAALLRPSAPRPLEVLILVPGRASVRADGVELGVAHDTLRAPLVPGRHRLEAQLHDRGDRIVSREVLVLEGSQPVFELR